MRDPGAPALGLEIENSWVKVVALGRGDPRCLVFPMPFHPGADRSKDIAEGLQSALIAFERETGVRPGSCRAAVASSCHFAFRTFREAHLRVLDLVAELLPDARVAAVDGLHSLDAARSAKEPLAFVLARTAGIRALCRQYSDAQLAIDCGSTSTEAVRTVVEPDLDLQEDSVERLRDGRLTWIGAIETPLDFVARCAEGWPLVPRMARMRAVTAILGARDPGLGVPAIQAARRELAQAVGLDEEVLGDSVDRIAQDLLEAAVSKLAAAFSQVLGPEPHTTEVAVMGVGAPMLAIPALAAIGVERVVNLEEAAGVPPNFGAATGLALLTLAGS